MEGAIPRQSLPQFLVLMRVPSECKTTAKNEFGPSLSANTGLCITSTRWSEFKPIISNRHLVLSILMTEFRHSQM